MLKFLLLVAAIHAASAQNCPAGVSPTPCFAPPCLFAACPRFPSANCTNDFCGGCNAVFKNSTSGEVIPRFACERNSNWPQCLASITCPRPTFSCGNGCPYVPDAVCNLNCDCSIVFTDRRTGSLLTARECGREIDERCPPAPFGGFGRCGSCPRRCPEGEICCPNGCLGSPSGSACIPIPITCPVIDRRRGIRFTCSNENYEGSECQLSCIDSNRFLIGTRNIICQNSGDWSHDLDEIECISQKNFDLRCPIVRPIRPANCPVCPSTCPRGQICCPTGCPGSTNCIVPPTAEPTRTQTCQRKAIQNMVYYCRTIGGLHFCTLRCKNGFTLIGSSFVRCIDGKFEPSLDGMSCNRKTTYRSCRTCG